MGYVKKSSSMNKITYSYELYEGHSNEKVISLNDEWNDLKKELSRIENEIKEIQDNCIHDFKFVSKGMYEDHFCCSLCGKDTVK